MPTPDDYTEVEVDGTFYSVGLNVTTTDEEVGRCYICGKPAVAHILDQLISITNTATYENVDVRSDLGERVQAKLAADLRLDGECDECAALIDEAFLKAREE